MITTTGQKMAHFGVIALATVEAPLLKMLDDKNIQKALDTQKIANPLCYPMYKRMSIVIPLVTGLPALILGFVGNKIKKNMKESTQLYLLEYGAVATVAGFVGMITLMNDRKKAGLKMFRPCGTQQQQQQQLQAAPAFQALQQAAASPQLVVRPLIVP